MIDSIQREKCTGCKMCADICPLSAITYTNDEKGFWYPSVDYSICIKCGKCKKACPALCEYQKERQHAPQVCAAWSINDNVRITSTSGGVFWEIASSFIQNGGIVVGCKYDEKWKSCYHAIATNIDELYDLKGSKYFQSDTAEIYKRVESLLKDNKEVLFCGTPCQNAALLSYLRVDFAGLYTMDFICRSINSPKAFHAYLDELEQKYNSRVVKVQLKNKNRGWQSLASYVEFANGEFSLMDKDNDPWVRGFIYNDLYTRKSCFKCRYKTLPRNASDISIGDFWGIKNQSTEDMFKGISVILVNSEKGTRLLDLAGHSLKTTPYTIEDVLPGNPALIRNPVPSEKSDAFFALINSGKSFSYSVEKCTRRTFLQKMKEGVKRMYGKIKKAKQLFIDREISIPLYIYYNYICGHIERKGKSKILPHKNTVINFEHGSKIILSGNNLEVGFNKLKGSKSETHIRMNRDAVWYCNNGGLLFYNTVLEIKEGASFESGYFSANGGSVIIVHKNVKFGEDVMIGRNVVIYDSDFHTLYDKQHNPCNPPKPVVIEDHVWLTTNVMVQKGVTIGRDSLIAAYTVVNKDVPPCSIIGGRSSGETIRDWVSWDRATCPLN